MLLCPNTIFFLTFRAILSTSRWFLPLICTKVLCDCHQFSVSDPGITRFSYNYLEHGSSADTHAYVFKITFLEQCQSDHKSWMVWLYVFWFLSKWRTCYHFPQDERSVINSSDLRLFLYQLLLESSTSRSMCEVITLHITERLWSPSEFCFAWLRSSSVSQMVAPTSLRCRACRVYTIY